MTVMAHGLTVEKGQMVNVVFVTMLYEKVILYISFVLFRGNAPALNYVKKRNCTIFLSRCFAFHVLQYCFIFWEAI